MPDARRSARGPFEEARAAFEKLSTQDKVTFAVEATFAAVGQVIESAGRHLASLLEDVVGETDRFGRHTGPPPPEAGPGRADAGPEEPPRQPGRRRRPPGGRQTAGGA